MSYQCRLCNATPMCCPPMVSLCKHCNEKLEQREGERFELSLTVKRQRDLLERAYRQLAVAMPESMLCEDIMSELNATRPVTVALEKLKQTIEPIPQPTNGTPLKKRS